MDKPPCMNLIKNRAEGCRYWKGLQNSIMKCMVIEFLTILTCFDHQNLMSYRSFIYKRNKEKGKENGY